MRKKTILVIILICLFVLFVTSNQTYTAYQSFVDNDVAVEIATWKINIDGQDIVTSTKDITLSNITWDNNHANDKTAAPGSKGIIKINIDPSEADVAIKYTISYEDHTINSDCILTVTSIALGNEELEKISDNSYGGIITMDQIKNKTTKTLVINVEWLDDKDNDIDISTMEGNLNFLNLEFNASQYTGT